MLYPEIQFESKLNFPEIRKWLEEDCLTNMGKEKVKDISFSNNPDRIKIWQQQNEIFKHLIDEDALYPKIYFEDIRPHLQKAKVANSFLEPEELLQIRQLLQLSDQWLEFFEDDESGIYSSLNVASPSLESRDIIISLIIEVIDSKGEIRDDASEKLREIRSDIRVIESRVRRSMNDTYQSAKEKGYLAEQTEITIRNGRLVIPMAVENKRAIRGYVHAHSSTGQTAFVEPSEVFEMNNELQDLITEERREIIRILTEVTKDIRTHINEIEVSMHFLADLDIIRSRAKLAVRINAKFPQLSKSGQLKLIDARHPLLFVHHKELNKEVIPLDLEINEKNRILLISGPNAGGKSVALTSLGILVYMYQCGLPVSLSEKSEMVIFNDIFIDIGDEQSIENDLSTYSSHLTNMREMLKYAGGKSLILLDEFGTGTDPQFGGAIAEVILEELNNKKCKGLINTHYSNLKAFADKTEGLINGAMLFDLENMEPLYKLEMGKPGSSFAFEVAEKIGLPQHILDKAKGNIGYSQIEYDRMLNELEAEKKELEELNRNMSKKDANLDKVASQYRAMKEKLQSERKELIEQAKKEAAGIVKGANKRIEKTIREIREIQADKSKTKELRENLNKYLDNTEESLSNFKKVPEKEKKEKVDVPSGPIGIGDEVELIDSGAKGEVINIKGKEAEIAIGNIRSYVKLKKLKKLSGPVKSKNESAGYSSFTKIDPVSFSPNLDVRGKRANDAIDELERFIDRAIMAGIKELSILHGKGDGILRKVIREQLKAYSQVKNFESEHVERGGDGITLVSLK
ncbi:endonuclease MutS2 [Hyphobacterium sp. CCMP332]|nr:endonuclease MutS2 [Hyphobacterium sp. CCMP332]